MTLHSLLWQLKFTRVNMLRAICSRLLLKVPPTAGRLLVYGQIIPFTWAVGDITIWLIAAKHVYYWMLFEDKKINSKREKYSQKKLLKKIKDKFKDNPAVAEEVEKRGLTAEQIHEDPTILLEILDKSLQ